MNNSERYAVYQTVADLGEEMTIRGTCLLNEPEKTAELLMIIAGQISEGRREEARETAKFLPEPSRTETLQKLFSNRGLNFFPDELLKITVAQIEGRKYIEARINADFLPEPTRTQVLHRIIKAQKFDNCFINNIRATARIMLNS